MSAVKKRIAVIERLGALDRIADPALQGLARIAASVAGSAYSAIHIFDETHQRRIASYAAPLEDFPAEESMCIRVVDSGQSIVTHDASLDPRFTYSPFTSGEKPVRFYASLPLRVESGPTFGTVCVFDEAARRLGGRDIAVLEDIAAQVSVHLELVSAVEELARAASRDELTGIANRLVLGERIAHGLARQLRHDERLIVAAIDLDGFKAVNDTHGHDAGDFVLREVARRISGAIRVEDLVARTGGDEFVVVAIEDPGGVGTSELADRIASVIVRGIELENGKVLHVGASVGVTEARRDDSVTSLLKRADEDMYVRKRGDTGRLKG